MPVLSPVDKSYCKKEQLIELLEKIRETKIEIIDIEPVKKDLEDIFVEIANQKIIIRSVN